MASLSIGVDSSCISLEARKTCTCINTGGLSNFLDCIQSEATGCHSDHSNASKWLAVHATFERAWESDAHGQCCSLQLVDPQSGCQTGSANPFASPHTRAQPPGSLMLITSRSICIIGCSCRISTPSCKRLPGWLVYIWQSRGQLLQAYPSTIHTYAYAYGFLDFV